MLKSYKVPLLLDTFVMFQLQNKSTKTINDKGYIKNRLETCLHIRTIILRTKLFFVIKLDV